MLSRIRQRFQPPEPELSTPEYLARLAAIVLRARSVAYDVRSGRHVSAGDQLTVEQTSRVYQFDRMLAR